MNDSKISVRYAKALFESAREKELLDEVRRDMEEVQKVCMVPEIDYLIHSPVIKVSQKCSAIDSVLGELIQPISLALLHLVIKNGRALYIQAIARNFVVHYKKVKGIKSAKFSSAASISQTMQSKIEQIIRKAMDSPIELETEINENLIGGFVIRVDDQQYDASVSTSLKTIKKQLLN